MDIGQIAKPMVAAVLGNTLGGPVAAVLTNINPSQLGQLGEMLKGLTEGFKQSPGTSSGGSIPQRPVPFSQTNININITINPLGSLQQPAAQGPLQSFGKVPEVGNDSQFPGLASAVNNRVTGSDANKSKFAMDGSNPWNKAGDKSDMAAVAWAMQKNENVRFDADRQQFYTTDSNGQARDVASLADVKAQIANAGGANPNNGAAQAAVGAFLDGRIGAQSAGNSPAATKSDTPQQTPQAQNDNPFKQIMELLDKLLQILSGQGGAPGGANGAGAGAGAGQIAGGAGRAEGAGSSAGSAGGVSGGSGAGSASGASGSSGAGSSSGISSDEAMVSKMGSSIDKMMGEAEQLMASDKPSDQIKGQMKMQQAMRMFEMVSKMLEQRSQAQAKAIQAIK